MAEARKLELMAKDGSSFIITASTEAGSTIYDDYALRWGNQTARLSDEDMRELVEFVGYPHETGDRADAAEAKLAEVQADLTAARVQVSIAVGELEGVRRNVRVLVERLKGAWWLDAASSYRALAEWLGQ